MRPRPPVIPPSSPSASPSPVRRTSNLFNPPSTQPSHTASNPPEIGLTELPSSSLSSVDSGYLEARPSSPRHSPSPPSRACISPPTRPNNAPVMPPQEDPATSATSIDRLFKTAENTLYTLVDKVKTGEATIAQLRADMASQAQAHKREKLRLETELAAERADGERERVEQASLIAGLKKKVDNLELDLALGKLALSNGRTRSRR